MIPQIIAGTFAVAFTLELVGSAAAAGAGYGLGRKYGRKLCNAIDHVESTITNSLDKFKN
jgi:hypothetical protein